MKAVILAAGMGLRLRPLTSNIPKGLIPIQDDKTLLERSLDAISKHGGFREVIIIVGYHADQIQQKIPSNYGGNLQIKYVLNPEYETTGSMYSLLCAKDSINGEDICILESDLLYDNKALHVLLQEEAPQDAILITKLQQNGDDVYICTDDKGRINRLGKVIPDKQLAKGALMGISRYSADFQSKLFVTAQHDHDSGIRKNKYYEECVFTTSQERDHPVYTVLCSDLVWTEIDNENDLQRAKEIVLPKLKQ